MPTQEELESQYGSLPEVVKRNNKANNKITRYTLPKVSVAINDPRYKYISGNINKLDISLNKDSNEYLESSAAENQNGFANFGRNAAKFGINIIGGFIEGISSDAELIAHPLDAGASLTQGLGFDNNADKADFSNFGTDAGSRLNTWAEEFFPTYDANPNGWNIGDVGKWTTQAGRSLGIMGAGVAEDLLLGLLAPETAGTSLALATATTANKAKLLSRIWSGGLSLAKKGVTKEGLAKLSMLHAKETFSEGVLEASEVIKNTRAKLEAANEANPNGKQFTEEEIDSISKNAGSTVFAGNALWALANVGLGKMMTATNPITGQGANFLSKMVDKISGGSTLGKVTLMGAGNTIAQIPEELYQESLNSIAEDTALNKVGVKSNQLNDLWTNKDGMLVDVIGGAVMGGAISNTVMSSKIGGIYKGEKNKQESIVNNYNSLLNNITANTLNTAGQLNDFIKEEATRLGKSKLFTTPTDQLTAEELAEKESFSDSVKSSDRYTNLSTVLYQKHNIETAIATSELDKRSEYLPKHTFEAIKNNIASNTKLNAQEKQEQLSILEEQYKNQGENTTSKFRTHISQFENNIEAAKKGQEKISDPTDQNYLDLQKVIDLNTEHLNIAKQANSNYNEMLSTLSDNEASDAMYLAGIKTKHELLDKHITELEVKNKRQLSLLDTDNTTKTELEAKSIVNARLKQGFEEAILNFEKVKEKAKTRGEIVAAQKVIDLYKSKIEDVNDNTKEIDKLLKQIANIELGENKSEVNIDTNYLNGISAEQANKFLQKELARDFTNFYSKENANNRKVSNLANFADDKRIQQEIDSENKKLRKNDDLIAKLEALKRIKIDDKAASTKSSNIIKEENKPTITPVEETLTDSFKNLPDYENFNKALEEYTTDQTKTIEELKLLLEELTNINITSSMSRGEILSAFNDILSKLPEQFKNDVTELVKYVSNIKDGKANELENTSKKLELQKQFVDNYLNNLIKITEAKINYLQGKSYLTNSTETAERQLLNDEVNILSQIKDVIKKVQSFLKSKLESIINNINKIESEYNKLNPDNKLVIDNIRELHYKAEAINEFLSKMANRSPESLKTRLNKIAKSNVSDEQKQAETEAAHNEATGLDHLDNENPTNEIPVTNEENTIVSKEVSNDSAETLRQLGLLQRSNVPVTEQLQTYLQTSNSTDVTKDIFKLLDEFNDGGSLRDLRNGLHALDLKANNFNLELVKMGVAEILFNSNFGSEEKRQQLYDIVLGPLTAVQKIKTVETQKVEQQNINPNDLDAAFRPNTNITLTNNDSPAPVVGIARTINPGFKIAARTTQIITNVVNGVTRYVSNGLVDFTVRLTKHYNPLLANTDKVKVGTKLELRGDYNFDEVLDYETYYNKKAIKFGDLLKEDSKLAEAFEIFKKRDKEAFDKLPFVIKQKFTEVLPIFTSLEGVHSDNYQDLINNRVGYIANSGWYSNDLNFENKVDVDNKTTREIAIENLKQIRKAFIDSHFTDTKFTITVREKGTTINYDTLSTPPYTTTVSSQGDFIIERRQGKAKNGSTQSQNYITITRQDGNKEQIGVNNNTWKSNLAHNKEHRDEHLKMLNNLATLLFTPSITKSQSDVIIGLISNSQIKDNGNGTFTIDNKQTVKNADELVKYISENASMPSLRQVHELGQTDIDNTNFVIKYLNDNGNSIPVVPKDSKTTVSNFLQKYASTSMTTNLRSITLEDGSKVYDQNPTLFYDVNVTLPSKKSIKEEESLNEVLEKLEESSTETVEDEKPIKTDEEVIAIIKANLPIFEQLLRAYNNELSTSDLSEEEIKELTKGIAILGLSSAEINSVINNLAAKILGKTEGSSLKQVSEKVKEDLFKELEAQRIKLNDLLNQLEVLDNSFADEHINNLKIAINKIDTIKENYDKLLSGAIEKIDSLDIFTNIDELATSESSNQSESFDKDTLSENPKNKIKERVKKLLFGVPDVNKKGEPIINLFGIEEKLDFNISYYFLLKQFAGMKPNFDEMLSKLKNSAQTNPTFKQFVKHLESITDEQTKMQFATDMSQSNYNSDFVMIEGKGIDKKVTIYNANANASEYKYVNKVRNTLSIIDTKTPEARKAIIDRIEVLNLENKKDLTEFFNILGLNLNDNTLETILNSTEVFRAKMTYLDMLKKVKEGLENYSQAKFISLASDNYLKDIYSLDEKNKIKVDGASYRDGLNSRFSYTAPTAIFQEFTRLKDINNQDEQKRIEKRLTEPFYKYSYYLSELVGDYSKGFTDSFGLTYASNQVLKFKDKDNQDKKMQDLTKGEIHMLSMAMFFINNPEYTTPSNGNIQATKVCKYLLSTISDKNKGLILQAPSFDFKEMISNADEKMKDFFIEQTVLGELARIVDHSEMNFKNYDSGALLFSTFPGINGLTKIEGGSTLISRILSKSQNKKLEEGEDIKEVYAEEITEIKEFLFGSTEESENWLDNEVETILNITIDNGIIKQNGDNYSSELIKFDKNDTSNVIKTKEEIVLALKDYILNNHIATANSYSTLFGDPALYFKSSIKIENKSLIEGVFDLYNKETGKSLTMEDYFNINNNQFDNVGKRLAMEIAPGYGQYLHNDPLKDNYVQIVASDFSMVSSNVEKFKKLYGELTGWTGKIDFTDAQSYITWKSRLDERLYTGKINQTKYNEVRDLIIKSETEELSKEELAILSPILFNTEKPVSTGLVSHTRMINGKERNFTKAMYVKDSAIVLLPSLTRGTELDKVRTELEKVEEVSGMNTKLSYSSAVKLGEESSIKIWDENGNFIENSITSNTLKDDKLNTESNTYTIIPKTNLRIQQETQPKSDKTKEQDKITLGSQLAKLLFNGEVLQLLGEEGKNLLSEYNNVFSKLADLKKDNYLDQYDLSDIKGIKNLNDLIQSEAKDRGFSKRELSDLELLITVQDLETGVRKNIKIKDYNNDYKILKTTFATPINFNSNFKKVDSLLNSIVNSNVVQVKVTGYSHILASNVGFTKGYVQNNKGEILDKEGNEIKLNGILYTNKRTTNQLGFNLKDSAGKLYSEILVASKFKDKEGNIIDIANNSEFKDKDGYLNLEKLPEELLYSIGFRIPSSSLASAARFKIAGFLPASAGDTVVIPEEFIKQMGLDFDIDKQNFYNHKYVVDKNNTFKKYSSVEETEKSQIQKIVDLHHEVLGNPKLQKLLSKVLNTDEVEADKANMEKKMNNTSNKFLSPLSTEYRFNKLLSGSGGKTGTGAYSLDVTFNSIAQQLKQTGTPINISLPFKIDNYSFENINLGNINTLDGSRTISEVLSENQNMAVDNEKLQVMSYLGINDDTLAISKIFGLVGLDKINKKQFPNCPVNLYSTLLLTQPLFKEYLQEEALKSNIYSNYTQEDSLEKVIKNTIKDFNDEEKKNLLELFLKFKEEGVIDKQNTHDLQLTVGLESTKGLNYKQVEAQIINLLQLYSVKFAGQQLQKIQSMINISSNGLSSNTLENINYNQERIKIDSPIINLPIIGASINGINNIFKEKGFISLGLNGLEVLNNHAELLPFNNSVFSNLNYFISNNAGTTTTKNKLRERYIQTLNNYINSYVERSLFGNSKIPREVIMKNLGNQLSSILTNPNNKKIVNNYNVLQSLNVIPNKKVGGVYYEISVDNSLDESSNKEDLQNSLISLWIANPTLQISADKSVSARDLITNLVRYSLLDNNANVVTGLYSIIPSEINNLLKVSKYRNIANDTLNNRSSDLFSDFTNQFFISNYKLLPTKETNKDKIKKDKEGNPLSQGYTIKENKNTGIITIYFDDSVITEINPNVQNDFFTNNEKVKDNYIDTIINEVNTTDDLLQNNVSESFGVVLIELLKNNPGVKLITDEDVIKGFVNTRPNIGNFIAAYEKGSVLLNYNQNKSWYKNNDGLVETLTHELVHSSTENELNNKDSEITKSFIYLHNRVIEHFNTLTTKQIEEALPIENGRINVLKALGILESDMSEDTKLKEFVSEIFANPYFRNVCNVIKTKRNKSILQVIKDNILKILKKLGVNEGSVLEEAYNNLFTIFEKNSTFTANEGNANLPGINDEVNMNDQLSKIKKSLKELPIGLISDSDILKIIHHASNFKKPILIYKGLDGKKDLNNNPINVHNLKNTSWGSESFKDANTYARYTGDIAIFIEEGLDIDYIKVPDSTKISKVRSLESKLINESDSDIIFLNTVDGTTTQDQVIMKGSRNPIAIVNLKYPIKFNINIEDVLPGLDNITPISECE